MKATAVVLILHVAFASDLFKCPKGDFRAVTRLDDFHFFDEARDEVLLTFSNSSFDQVVYKGKKYTFTMDQCRDSINPNSLGFLYKRMDDFAMPTCPDSIVPLDKKNMVFGRLFKIPDKTDEYAIYQTGKSMLYLFALEKSYTTQPFERKDICTTGADEAADRPPMKGVWFGTVIRLNRRVLTLHDMTKASPSADQLISFVRQHVEAAVQAASDQFSVVCEEDKFCLYDLQSTTFHASYVQPKKPMAPFKYEDYFKLSDLEVNLKQTIVTVAKFAEIAVISLGMSKTKNEKNFEIETCLKFLAFLESASNREKFATKLNDLHFKIKKLSFTNSDFEKLQHELLPFTELPATPAATVEEGDDASPYTALVFVTIAMVVLAVTACVIVLMRNKKKD